MFESKAGAACFTACVQIAPGRREYFMTLSYLYNLGKHPNTMMPDAYFINQDLTWNPDDPFPLSRFFLLL